MTVVLPVAIAGAERMKGVGGKELITAVALGVDVAAGLGVAATTGLRFFRPATTGAFGGTAALGKLMGLDQAAMVNAFSIAYGQCCGTMQAHTEGSALLAMQMGFNARNAIIACDLAARGFDGPKNVLEGPFGYFKLIETSGAPARVTSDLGRRWFITELAHKPFPTGRATHGIIEACLELKRQHGSQIAAIDHVTARVPPLVRHLWPAAPGANERQLCAFVRATWPPARCSGRGARGFHTAGVLPRRQALAQRISIEFGTPAIPMR
jgi:2-methylcitrate dehydratase PrpD